MLRMVIAIAFAAMVLALTAPQLAMRLIHAEARAPLDAPAGEADARGRITLAADRGGHYRTSVSINGRTFPVMVDTGASVVTLSHQDARALGLAGALDRYDVPVRTANGTAYARRLRLDRVRLGSIVVRDVEAMAMPPDALGESLLGMSFLGRLHRMEARAGRLVLEE